MNRTDLIQKLKQLEGISQDERAYLINLVNTKKKYGLVWEDKPEDVEEQLRTQLPVLHEVVERRILAKELPRESKLTEPKEVTLFSGVEIQEIQNINNGLLGEVTTPNHILIEGDNLHALTALSFTHEGIIDIIYFDPPYNRGENDFKYNDNWIQKDNPFKHSLWLSFISKRLSIAKRLLNEKGVIIIHIDEHEFDALNLFLENEVFSEENNLGLIIWNKQNPKGDAKDVATMHEYVLVYCKNKQDFLSLENILTRAKPNAVQIIKKAKRLFSKIGKTEIPDEIKDIVKPFDFSKEILKDFEITYDLNMVIRVFQNWLNRQDFSGGEKAYKFIDKKGKVYQSVSMAWPNKEQAPDDYFVPLIHPVTGKLCPIPGRGWRNPSATMQKLIDQNLVLFGKDETTQPRRKYFLEENMFENTPSLYNNGTSDDAFLKEIGIEFQYPKPTEVAMYFLKSIHPEPKIILDFFAGSGTTLHATMQLNASDGGNRQCILVNNNENNICEEVTYERNRRVIQGYTNSKGDWVKGLTNNNLRYYKSGFVAREHSLKNKRELTKLATELLCIKEDCYQESIIEKADANKGIRLFDDNGKRMLVVYDDALIELAVELIKNIVSNQTIEENGIKVYVFSPGQYSFVEEFEEVLPHITLCALPDAIYKAYLNVLPKKRKQLQVESEDVPENEILQINDNQSDLFN